MSSPASDMSNVTLTLPALKRSRSANIGVITRSENAVSAIFNKEASALTYKEIGTLKANLTMCERKKKELEELNQQISNVLNDDEDALEVELEEAEKIYLQVDCLMEMITTMLDDRGKYSTESVKDDDSASGTGSYKSTSQRGAGRNQDTCLKLPKLNSPTFSGRYDQWLPFLDSFDGAVHSNASLSDVQKLQYLKGALKDEPFRLLSHLPTTNANYSVARELLKDRYADVKMISHAHLEAIFEFTPMKHESSAAIRRLINTYTENTMALTGLGLKIDQCDLIWVHVLAKKLDPETRRQWELSCAGSDVPKIKQMKKFLEERSRALEATKDLQLPSIHRKNHQGNSDQSGNSKKDDKVQTYHTNSAKTIICPCCSGDHRVYQCTKFQEMSISNRRQEAKSKRLCFNCLSLGHQNHECKSKSTCQTCRKGHHSLLHIHTDPNKQPGPENKFAGHGGTTGATTILGTVLIEVKTANGGYHNCRALLDSGSECSFVTTSCANRLKLPIKKLTLQLTRVGGGAKTVKSGSVNLETKDSQNQSLHIEAFTLQKLSGYLPRERVNIPNSLDITRLKLSDPDFDKPKEIDIILGCDVYNDIVGCEKIKLTDKLYARDTLFGWMISGRTPGPPTTFFKSFHVSIDDSLRKFWELEEIPDFKKTTTEEDRCESHFKETTILQNGRFTVQLPFKPNSQLGDSLAQAKRRFNYLERRLEQNPELKDRYTAFIDEFLDMGHMEYIPPGEIEKPVDSVYYLPHHCVFKEDSTTTKLRVVFDGSATTSTGQSLNDTLMVGPTVQDDLYSIIMRFRFYPIALSADIAKMYRQVALEDKSKDFHRILWRSNKSDEIKHLRMTRVTYGIASSAFHSTRCLNEVADQSKNPMIKESLKNCFYVDDFLGGANDKHEAERLISDLCEELNSHEFPLRKWTSSNAKIIEGLPEHLREKSDVLELFSDEYKIKALGVSWKPNKDIFCFSTALPELKLLTKRTLLSTISKLFDPMGWLAPFIINFKCLMQQLWVQGFDWDSEVDQKTKEKWYELTGTLPQLLELQIPRSMSSHPIKEVQLHVFCDASEKAYAAAIYARITNDDGKTFAYLLTSKTKVAPVKAISVPKLELCGASLATKLLKSVHSILRKTNLKITSHAWTDSTIVLQWLAQLPRTWNTFVANRVSQIQETLPRSDWKHVPTAVNPADLASRGVLADTLISSSLWWNGPDWLTKDERHWPNLLPSLVEAPEKRTVKAKTNAESEQIRTVLANHAQNEEMTDGIFRLKDYSTWNKTVRIACYVLSFVQHLKHRISTNYRKRLRSKRTSDVQLEEDCLSPKNRIMAKMLILRLDQEIHFKSELNCLKVKRELSKTSKLLNLSPFFDKDYDLLRVGGRLSQSNYPTDKKFPILVSKKSDLVSLLIRKYHEDTLHGGGQLVLNTMREEIWIIGGRDLVRQFIRRCMRCVRFSQQPTSQFMADLPTERITPAKPFAQCGIDFAGPFEIKEAGVSKIYVAVFVCLATKAIHLEMVTRLTKEACILSLKRFTARRGKPEKILSDNGSNFIGARNDLIKIKELLDKNGTDKSVVSFVNSQGTEWVTIPPRAPHFGGLWEAAVKSMKRHMRKVIGLQRLSFEEFLTILNQIEAVLNSRPLYPMSSDPNDPTPLTPAHFLIGESLLTLPSADIQVSTNVRYRLLQNMIKDFWKVWKRDYLITLQIRKKWFTDGPEFKVGNLVLLAEDNERPLEWKTGRIIEVYPGNDSIVRVVKVKTTTGEYIRPVAKLRKLPV